MKHIKVLQHHIELGTRSNAFWCPIALAIREQYTPERVSVGMQIYVDNDSWGMTPQEALDFICSFDRGNTVFPFEFDLHEPEEVCDARLPV
jgi:hypothetical protein